MLSYKVKRVISDIENIKFRKELGELEEIQILEVDELFSNAVLAFSGPIDSPYENYWFRIRFEWSTQYPFKPPTCTILDKVWNPFIEFDTGKICADIFDYNYTPAITIEGFLLSISSLLSQTKMSSFDQGFANPEAAIEMKLNYPYFCEHARQICQNGAYKHEKIREKIMRGIPEEHHVQIESSEMKETIEKELQIGQYKKKITEPYIWVELPQKEGIIGQGANPMSQEERQQFQTLVNKQKQKIQKHLSKLISQHPQLQQQENMASNASNNMP